MSVLDYVTKFESVQGGMVLAIMLLGGAFMLMRRLRQSEDLKSADKRLVNVQQIEMAYANQMRKIKQDNEDKPKFQEDM